MTHSNFQTGNKLGQALTAPSKQSILPVVCGGNGNIQGFFPIATTTFNGTETSITIDGFPVAITTVTLPKVVSDNTGTRVQQYMAAVYPDNVVRKKPWIGYASFVDNDDVGYLGARHVMPTQGWHTSYYLGPLVTNLKVTMYDESFTPAVQPPPVVQNGTIRWVASMDSNPTGLDCGFFDFLWTDLFKASTTGIDPVSINVVSNPPGGYFKSTLVPTPVVAPLGGVQFNTVRIIRLQDTPAGTYTFNYVVTDTKNQSTNCQLVLTVV